MPAVRGVCDTAVGTQGQARMSVRMTARDAQRGLSLIEVLVTMAFLGVLLVPLSDLYLSAYEGVESVGHYDQGFNLAQDLMEEMLTRDFEDPDVGAGSFGTEEGTRALYDDIDDYDDWGPNSPPMDINGVALADYADFTRSATVDNVEDVSDTNMPRASLAVRTDGSTNFKLLTVTVTWDGGRQVETLQRIVSNYQ